MYDLLSKAIALIVIKGLADRQLRLSERSAVNLFLGHKTSYENSMIKNDELFGSLHFLRRSAMISVFKRLVTLGLLEMRQQGKHLVFNVTAAGLAFIDDPNTIIDVLYEQTEKHNALYYELRMTRRMVAADKEITEEAVCSDEILEILSVFKPISTEAMNEIRGVPGGFVFGYGDLFIKDIIRYLSREIIS